jgi:kumamolisin
MPVAAAVVFALLAATPATSRALPPLPPVARTSEVGSAPASRPLQLVLALRTDAAGLRQLASAVATPGAPQYGEYESIGELAQRFGASASARRQVVQYLRRVGATAIRVDATGLFVDATLSAGRAQGLFDTRLAEFATASATRFIAPTQRVRVPAPLRGVVDGVIGLDTEPVFSAPALFGDRGRLAPLHGDADQQAGSAYMPVSGTPAGCSTALALHGFTPNQYLTAYDYDPLHAAGVLGQGERVALIEIDGYRASDVRTFAQCFGLKVPRIQPFAVGVKKPLAPGGEATLDLEVLTAAAPGLTAIDVYESSPDAAHTLKALTAPLQNSGFKPQVISASLGLCEPFTVEAVGQAGINATEAALEEAAASGITVLASSGDSGSADCTASGLPLDHLAVNYPASSWWVTGVGGTNLQLSATNAIVAQPVWNDAGAVPGAAGGGGPSMFFKRPAYQTGTVAAASRAVPDASMLADIAPGYTVFCTASPDCVNPQNPSAWQTVGGTSASTPLLAGGFALVDQWLRIHGRQDLGLANPLLYDLGRNSALAPQAFSDVTQGGNDVGPFIPGNGQPLGCCSAAPGFDMGSGWGSVNVTNFANLAVLSQPSIVAVGLTLPRNQRPVRAGRILTTVSCSGACLMGAYATIGIGRSKPFAVFSSVYRLRSRGRKTIAIKLAGSHLRALDAGLARDQRIVAAVMGAIVDVAGNIERHTKAKQLAIRG